jgi:hypothetical protein
MKKENTIEVAPTLAALPMELKDIYYTLIDMFLDNVDETDNRNYPGKSEYYYKWFWTWHLVPLLNISCSKLRYRLSKLEKLGFVKAKRSPNGIGWSAININGFKQHQFEDYYCRVE